MPLHSSERTESPLLTIRPATTQDLPELSRIDVAAFSKDELFLYLCPRLATHPKSFCSHLHRLLRRRFHLPSFRIYVCTTSQADGVDPASLLEHGSSPQPKDAGKSASGEKRQERIVGSCVLQRHGTSAAAKSWRKLSFNNMLHLALYAVLDTIMHIFRLDRSVSRTRLRHLASLAQSPDPLFSSEESGQTWEERQAWSERLELIMLSVDPDWQGKGVGGKLVSFCQDLAKEEGVGIALDSSDVARGFYTRRGFRGVGICTIDSEAGLESLRMVWDGKP
jgi:ribosomal protein S18 acetylase RimI-like enzyme